MSIISVQEDYSVMVAEDHIDPSQPVVYFTNPLNRDGNGHIVPVPGFINAGGAKRKFQVLFDTSDSAIDRPFLAMDSASVPWLWDYHPTYAYWFVKNRRAYFGSGPCEVFVEVEYEYIADPLTEPALVEYFFEKTKEPIDRGYKLVDGVEKEVAITNSSDELYDPAIEKDFTDLGIRITRNESTYDPLVKKTYIDSFNSVDWSPSCITGKTFAAETVKAKMINGSPRRHGTISYFNMVYEFLVRDDYDKNNTLIGWKRRILDQGLRSKNPTTKAIATIKDSEGKDITSPVKLDGAGQPLAEGIDPYFHLFRVDKKMDFAALGL